MMAQAACIAGKAPDIDWIKWRIKIGMLKNPINPSK
jgi:hypothetical protein